MPTNSTRSASALPPEQQQTDLAAALEKVMADMSEKQLSGILLLTDGRTNGPHSVEPLVQRLGVQQVPVSSIVFGGTKPPMDAGVISVDAPETVAPKDRVLANAEIKLDGLAGKEARITLNDGVQDRGHQDRPGAHGHRHLPDARRNWPTTRPTTACTLTPSRSSSSTARS